MRQLLTFDRSFRVSLLLRGRWRLWHRVAAAGLAKTPALGIVEHNNGGVVGFVHPVNKEILQRGNKRNKDPVL
jgi:hypothetical protein